MFRKALPRALPHSSRAFHPSSSVAKLVATNPAKAEEVKVSNTLSADDTLLLTFLPVLVIGKVPTN